MVTGIQNMPYFWWNLQNFAFLMMTSSNGNIFRVTGHLCGEFTGNSLHKGQWRGALMFSLICVWINDWVNNREAGDLRRYRAHCDVTVMSLMGLCPSLYLVGLLTSGFKTCGNVACGPWWRYWMETFSTLLARCTGNSPVIGEFPSQRPVTRSFDVFFCAWTNGCVNNRDTGD